MMKLKYFLASWKRLPGSIAMKGNLATYPEYISTIKPGLENVFGLCISRRQQGAFVKYVAGAELEFKPFPELQVTPCRLSIQ